MLRTTGSNADNRPPRMRVDLPTSHGRTAAFGGLLVLVAASMFYFGRSEDGIECSRAGSGSCTLFNGVGVLEDDAEAFRVTSVGEVRWVPFTKPKSGPLGKTVLVLKGKGHQVEVAIGERESAARAYAEIAAFFEDESIQALRVGAKRNRMFMWWGLLLALIGVAITAKVSRKTRYIVVERIPGSGEVTLRNRALLFGSSQSSIRSRITSVDVEHGTVEKSLFERSAERTEPGFRIVLIHGEGPPTPITTEFFKERWHMEAAARKLKTFLELDDKSDIDTEGEHADQGDLDPVTKTDASEPVVADTSFIGSPTTPRKPSFLGKGLLFYLPFLVIAAVGGGYVYLNSLDQGTLKVKCTYRCRMGSSECLPGGSFQGTYDPGTYKIQVWNPNTPGNWDTHRLVVKKGETTSFECTPKK